LRLPGGKSLEDFIFGVEQKVTNMVGEFTLNEYKAFKNIVKHKKRADWVFSELGAELTLRSRPPGPDKKMQPHGATSSVSIGVPSKSCKKMSSRGKDKSAEATGSSITIFVLPLKPNP
jgi:hypothetical protein